VVSLEPEQGRAGSMQSKDSRGSNLRLALILASVAAVFFAGIVAKYTLLQ
jgi:hypothetical protein